MPLDSQEEGEKQNELLWLGKAERGWHSASCRSFHYNLALIRIVRQKAEGRSSFSTNASLIDSTSAQEGCLHKVLTDLDQLNRRVRAEFIDQASQPNANNPLSLYSRLLLDPAKSLRDMPVDVLHLRSTFDASLPPAQTSPQQSQDDKPPPDEPSVQVVRTPVAPMYENHFTQTETATSATALQSETDQRPTESETRASLLDRETRAPTSAETDAQSVRISPPRKRRHHIPLYVGGRRRRRAVLTSRSKALRPSLWRSETGQRSTDGGPSFRGSNKQSVSQTGSQSKSMTIINIALTAPPPRKDSPAESENLEAPDYEVYQPTVESGSARRRRCRDSFQSYPKSVFSHARFSSFDHRVAPKEAEESLITNVKHGRSKLAVERGVVVVDDVVQGTAQPAHSRASVDGGLASLTDEEEDVATLPYSHRTVRRVTDEGQDVLNRSELYTFGRRGASPETAPVEPDPSKRSVHTEVTVNMPSVSVVQTTAESTATGFVEEYECEWHETWPSVKPEVETSPLSHRSVLLTSRLDEPAEPNSPLLRSPRLTTLNHINDDLHPQGSSPGREEAARWPPDPRPSFLPQPPALVSRTESEPPQDSFFPLDSDVAYRSPDFPSRHPIQPPPFSHGPRAPTNTFMPPAESTVISPPKSTTMVPPRSTISPAESTMSPAGRTVMPPARPPHRTQVASCPCHFQPSTRWSPSTLRATDPARRAATGPFVYSENCCQSGGVDPARVEHMYPTQPPRAEVADPYQQTKLITNCQPSEPRIWYSRQPSQPENLRYIPPSGMETIYHRQPPQTVPLYSSQPFRAEPAYLQQPSQMARESLQQPSQTASVYQRQPSSPETMYHLRPIQAGTTFHCQPPRLKPVVYHRELPRPLTPQEHSCQAPAANLFATPSRQVYPSQRVVLESHPAGGVACSGHGNLGVPRQENFYQSTSSGQARPGQSEIRRLQPCDAGRGWQGCQRRWSIKRPNELASLRFSEPTGVGQPEWADRFHAPYSSSTRGGTTVVQPTVSRHPANAQHASFYPFSRETQSTGATTQYLHPSIHTETAPPCSRYTSEPLQPVDLRPDLDASLGPHCVNTFDYATHPVQAHHQVERGRPQITTPIRPLISSSAPPPGVSSTEPHISRAGWSYAVPTTSVHYATTPAAATFDVNNNNRCFDDRLLFQRSQSSQHLPNRGVAHFPERPRCTPNQSATPTGQGLSTPPGHPQVCTVPSIPRWREEPVASRVSVPPYGHSSEIYRPAQQSRKENSRGTNTEGAWWQANAKEEIEMREHLVKFRSKRTVQFLTR